MAKKGPAYYNVTITAARNYEPGKGPPRKNQLWQFSQVVQSSGGYPGALSAMVDKFFDLYPNHAVILPVGEKGQSILTRGNRAGLKSYLDGKKAGPKGDYSFDSADASLRIHKMRAMSGETPVSLTPKSDQEYSDKLHHNNESIQWWNDPIVQMPAPIYVLDKAAGPVEDAPNMIKYKGRFYRRAEAVPAENISSAELKELFFASMTAVAEQMTSIHQTLTKASEQLLEDKKGEEDPVDMLSSAAQRTYREVLPSILNARDVAAVLGKK
jgi:hypothetical protein